MSCNNNYDIVTWRAAVWLQCWSWFVHQKARWENERALKGFKTLCSSTFLSVCSQSRILCARNQHNGVRSHWLFIIHHFPLCCFVGTSETKHFWQTLHTTRTQHENKIHSGFHSEQHFNSTTWQKRQTLLWRLSAELCSRLVLVFFLQ